MRVDLKKILQSIKSKKATDTLNPPNKKVDNRAGHTAKQSRIKELPPIVVYDKTDPRIKKYKDSLNLYNAGLKLAERLSDAEAMGSYMNSLESVKSGLITKKQLDEAYIDNKKFYRNQFVEAYLKGRNPDYGGIIKGGKSSEKMYEEDKSYYKQRKEKAKKSDDYQRRYTSDVLMKGYEELDKLNKNIKPIAYSGAAELPTIPIYKKPVQPVEYRKPQPKKEVEKKQEISKKQDTVIQKMLNSYEGTPVYSPGAGSGMPSALIGFMNKKGDVKYIQPEDFDRFAVPSYGKKYIESKTKKK